MLIRCNEMFEFQDGRGVLKGGEDVLGAKPRMVFQKLVLGHAVSELFQDVLDGQSGSFKHRLTEHYLRILFDVVTPLHGKTSVTLYHRYADRTLACVTRYSTAILTARPLVTCVRIPLCGPSAMSELISIPRFMGPGCMTKTSFL